MDLVDGFRVLVAAVETGSFTGAGQRLGMSPKLASKYLAELEDRLGAPLLARTTRKLGLTPAGEMLMTRAPQWLDMLDDMTGEISEPARGLSGLIRLTAPLAYGEEKVLGQLQRFGELHPAVEIDLRLSDRYLDLASDGIDLALRIGTLGDSALIARRIGAARFLVVGAPAYFARRPAPQTLSDLKDHDCIRDSNMRNPQTWPLTQPERVPIGGRFTVSSLSAAYRLALAGHGLAYCPDYLVNDDLAAGRLVALAAPFTGPEMDIHIVHLPQRRMARRTRALMDFLVRDG